MGIFNVIRLYFHKYLRENKVSISFSCLVPVFQFAFKFIWNLAQRLLLKMYVEAYETFLKFLESMFFTSFTLVPWIFGLSNPRWLRLGLPTLACVQKSPVSKGNRGLMQTGYAYPKVPKNVMISSQGLKLRLGRYKFLSNGSYTSWFTRGCFRFSLSSNHTHTHTHIHKTRSSHQLYQVGINCLIIITFHGLFVCILLIYLRITQPVLPMRFYEVTIRDHGLTGDHFHDKSKGLAVLF